MILVDDALERRAREGRPIRVGVVGAGFMARGLVRQIRSAVPGMRVVAMSNRTVERAREALLHAGYAEVRSLPAAPGAGRLQDGDVVFVTDDPGLLCASEQIDVVVEATGAIEFGAHVLTTAIAHGKDVVSMNAELDATVGAVLQERAREAGVLVTGCDGDQPGVQMNLLRTVRGLGLTPLVAGNIKGLQDHYRTPETQRAFAAHWARRPRW